MLAALGFGLCGIGFQPQDGWGDAVYIRHEAREQLGKKFDASVLKARWSQKMHLAPLAGILRKRLPRLHSLLRRIFLRAGT